MLTQLIDELSNHLRSLSKYNLKSIGLILDRMILGGDKGMPADNRDIDVLPLLQQAQRPSEYLYALNLAHLAHSELCIRYTDLLLLLARTQQLAYKLRGL